MTITKFEQRGCHHKFNTKEKAPQRNWEIDLDIENN